VSGRETSLELSYESVLEAATQLVGAAGDHDSFRPALEVLLRAYEREAGLSRTGRKRRWGSCVRYVVNRRRLAAALDAKPDARKLAIRRPLFITGMHRTGTTFLHQLMSQDRGWHAPRLWELVVPALSPYGSENVDERRREAERWLAGFQSVAPQLSNIHPLALDGPEECNHVTRLTFESPMLELMNDVPSYSEWLANRDMSGVYAYHRSYLQHLLSFRPDARLLLKDPFHLWSLGALHGVFPDAAIVVLHRDPLESIPSLCSLCAVVRSTTCDAVDLRRLGDEWVSKWSRALDRMMETRPDADARYLDITHDELTRDAIGTVRRIYEHFDYPLSPGAVDDMQRWHAGRESQPQRHRYDLERFGLDAANMRRRFRTYSDRFGLT
jgi:hypothetical protein